MKKNRLLALLCAVLLAFSCVMPVLGLIAVEDENGKIYYSTGEEESTTAPSPLKIASQKLMKSVRAFWKRWGVLTVVIVLLVAIVTAITISEMERQKKERPPKPSHNKQS